MIRLVFCISFLIIIFITQTAHTAITRSLPLRSPTLQSLRHDKAALATERFGDEAQPTTSDVSLFSLFERRESGFDYDALSMFAQGVKVSEPRWTNFSVPLVIANTSNDIITTNFRHSDVYSHNDHHSKRHSWFSPDMIDDIDTKFMENEGSSNLRTLILTNYQGWIPDAEYDVLDVVPAPGAVILGGLGIVMIGWMRRRRTL